MPVAVKNQDDIKAQANALRSKRQADQEKKAKEKKDWYGLVYCDANGYASIIGPEGSGIWLGKSSEIIPYLKSRGIDGENVNSVFQAAEELQAEQKEDQKNQEIPAKAKNKKPRLSKTQSCHSATKKPQRYISIPPQKTHRATFLEKSLKNNTKLLKLLESLVKRDIGIPTIHRELNEQGYAVPYRTVGRWVAHMRSKELL